MPTIHVSDKVWDEINERRKGDEPPTDTLERIFERDDERIREIVQDEISDMVRLEALE